MSANPPGLHRLREGAGRRKCQERMAGRALYRGLRILRL